MMCCNALRNGKLKTKSVKLGIFGLDNAGKTTATKAIIGESLDSVVPTVGYSSYKKKIGQHEITFYDLGGGKRVRDIWKHYLAEVYGLIFVVDSTEADRLIECRDELQKLLSNPKVQGKPVLLLANKQDKGNALDDKEIANRINLEDLVTQNKCHCRLELCSANIGIGNKVDPSIRAGLKWLLRIIDVLRETAGLEQRVMMDTEEAQRIEREQAKEKRLQVQKAREERLKAQQEKDGGKEDDEKEPQGSVDPFKPIHQAVVDAEKAAPPKIKSKEEVVVKNKVEPLLLAEPMSQSTIRGSTLPKLTELPPPPQDDQINSSESSPHNQNDVSDSSAATADQAARRRRRRPRQDPQSTLQVEKGSTMGTNGELNESKSHTPLNPISSNQSPTLPRIERTPRNANGQDNSNAPIAATLRLSGTAGIVEQQSSVAMSTAYTRQEGPNVTSSDAFI